MCIYDDIYVISDWPLKLDENHFNTLSIFFTLHYRFSFLSFFRTLSIIIFIYFTSMSILFVQSKLFV